MMEGLIDIDDGTVKKCSLVGEISEGGIEHSCFDASRTS